MGKKGEAAISTFIYIALAVLVLLVSSYGFYVVLNADDKVSEAELAVFTSSLSKYLETDSSDLGNAREVKLAIPSGVSMVCFIDRTREIDEFAQPEATIYAEQFQDADVLLRHGNAFIPQKVGNVRLDRMQNPFCIRPKGISTSIRLENMGEFQDITSGEEKAESKCASLAYNGKSTQKLDFAFVASGYNSLEDFSEDANEFAALLQNSPPFSSFSDKMNFFIVEDHTSLVCTADSLIRCNEFQVRSLASNCPNDFTVVLHKNYNMINPVRSSSIGSLVKVSVSPVETKAVLLHELGHGIANLADEYVDEDYYRSINFVPDHYPNCDYSGCMKFGGSGCFPGCSLGEFYRPTTSSIMRSLSDTSYNSLSENAIIQKMSQYS